MSIDKTNYKRDGETPVTQQPIEKQYNALQLKIDSLQQQLSTLKNQVNTVQESKGGQALRSKTKIINELVPKAKALAAEIERLQNEQRSLKMGKSPTTKENDFSSAMQQKMNALEQQLSAIKSQTKQIKNSKGAYPLRSKAKPMDDLASKTRAITAEIEKLKKQANT